MERTVLKYAPDYWNASPVYINTQIILGSDSEEYKQIEYEIQEATRSPNLKFSLISRNQNVYDYGQVLVREQLLLVSKPHHIYYRVRRYITIHKLYRTTALEYNLDHRRCGKASLSFQKYINRPTSNEIVLVVQVITTDPNADFLQPTNSSDYFIDYIAEI
ncbi:hypothetical protein NQ315_009693 [Exocentrus adspersus]|uniref:Uncharacterized protein n=1 Tax=Exocentrus adspersus TaxID=1586481 RepID=A0AAV8WJB1_9CUCU|nr:hypothetical protein NQ315_009693 [Exocentrus adspersus]